MGSHLIRQTHSKHFSLILWERLHVVVWDVLLSFKILTNLCISGNTSALTPCIMFWYSGIILHAFLTFTRKASTRPRICCLAGLPPIQGMLPYRPSPPQGMLPCLIAWLCPMKQVGFSAVYTFPRCGTLGSLHIIDHLVCDQRALIPFFNHPPEVMYALGPLAAGLPLCLIDVQSFPC